MSSSRIPLPAQSQGLISTPRKYTPQRSRSVCSVKSNNTTQLTALISDSFKLSPMPRRQSVLNDVTDIEVPGRKSWWKNLGENSTDVMEILSTKDVAEVNNIADEFDVEVLSQEKQNYTLDLPESSDGESISSIVIPQRKLFTQKDNQTQKNFGNLINNRETLAKLQKSHFGQEKDIDIGPKNLFNRASKTKTKPIFPAALLNISAKANKTKELPPADVKGQVRNLFGSRPGTKRKNIYADFIVSESEDEIPEIQPRVFGFQKNAQKERDGSRVGRSPTSSIDLEMDEWKLLPSSTMVEHQLEEATAPAKRARLSKQESESNTNSTTKNKSIISSNSKLKDVVDVGTVPAKIQDDIETSENNLSFNSSNNVRVTRNKSKSIKENSLREENTKVTNKSKNTSKSNINHPKKSSVLEKEKGTEDENKDIEMKSIENEQEIENSLTEQVPPDDDEDFTLEYENDDEQQVENNTEDNKKENTQINKTNIQDKNKTLKINKEQQNDEQLNEDIGIQAQKQLNNPQNKNLSLLNGSFKHQNREFSNSQNTEKLNKSKIANNSPKNKIKSSDENVRKTQNGSQNVVENENIHLKNVNKSQSMNNEDEKKNEQTKSGNEKDNVVELELQSESDSIEQNEKEDENKIHDNKEEKIALQGEETEEKDEIEDEGENKSKDEVENEDRSKLQNESEADKENTAVENEEPNESEDEQSNKSENEESNENEDEEQNESDEDEENAVESEVQNESETEEANESENEDQNENNEDEENAVLSEIQNESENDEQFESDDEVQNESDNEEENAEASMEGEENEVSNQTVEGDESNDDHNDISEQIDVDQEQNDSDDDINVEEQNESIEVANERDVEQNESEQEESENEDSNVQNESDNNIDVNEAPADITSQSLSAPDTTGRHRNQTNVKSPEAILHNKTNQIESVTVQGRNTTERKTESIIKNGNISPSLSPVSNIKPSLAPVRESTAFSDGTRNSSAEGSGWDSHRTTRKTLRQTFGKDFTPRKSLRALVMEKSAKRHTNFADNTKFDIKIPQANSTELPAFNSYHEPLQVDETVEESEHEVSARTRQTTLDTYLQKIKQNNLERKRKMEEEIRSSLKAPTTDVFNPFKMPQKPIRRIKPMQNKPKSKQLKSSLIPIDMLPSEVLEDMKYKPPKRFQPSNAAWITKRLYKFLESKLEAKYDYKARVRAEKLVERLFAFVRETKRSASERAVDELKREMARLEVVQTHFDFYQFFHEFMPREMRVKVVPDVVNRISLPKNGVFSNILQ